MKKYFRGYKISEYGIENGYVDYGTLSHCFDAVLNNEIIPKTYDIGDWEQISGFQDDPDDPDDREIFQFYIVSPDGVEVLKEAEEIVFYNDTLHLYVWGVTHLGTSWDYVLTNIKIDKKG